MSWQGLVGLVPGIFCASPLYSEYIDPTVLNCTYPRIPNHKMLQVLQSSANNRHTQNVNGKSVDIITPLFLLRLMVFIVRFDSLILFLYVAVDTMKSHTAPQSKSMRATERASWRRWMAATVWTLVCLSASVWTLQRSTEFWVQFCETEWLDEWPETTLQ